MFFIPPNQASGETLSCPLDSATKTELGRYKYLVQATKEPTSVFGRIWNHFLNTLGDWIPCLSSPKKLMAEKVSLLKRAENELQTDLNRTWVLFLNGKQYKKEPDFTQAIPVSEEQTYEMLTFSYQKVWAIFMNSLQGAHPEGIPYCTVSSGRLQSAEWKVSDEGKVTLVAKSIFAVIPNMEALEFSDDDKQVLSLTFEYTLGEGNLSYQYEESPWKELLFNTYPKISRLEPSSSLREIMESMHELNVFQGNDIRQQILETYNATQAPANHLPTTFEDGKELLDDVYNIDTPALLLAFLKTTEQKSE
ncbi:MAG: hypothetical protein KBC64_07425 [Simkaniaceae bacterium]|nr:hypothetical protein [Simkaniaceae bacterium]